MKQCWGSEVRETEKSESNLTHFSVLRTKQTKPGGAEILFVFPASKNLIGLLCIVFINL